MDIKSAFEYLATELDVIASAPVAFISSVLICATACWFILRWANRQQVDVLKQSLALKEDLIMQRERLISELQPKNTRYSLLTNEQLQREALDLVRRLREFYRVEEQREQEIQRYDEHLIETGQGFSAKQFTEATGRRKQELRRAFGEHFRSDALLIRDNLLERLPSHPPGGIYGPGGEYRVDFFPYEGEHIAQISVVADQLERLAKQVTVGD
jgi:hypothetical protein